LSASIQPNLRQCPHCFHDLSLGELACAECHALIYSTQLESLAKKAKAFEAAHQFSEARETWQQSLAMLPHDSKQAEWVRDHVRALELAQPPAPDPQSAKSHPWAKRLGPLAPIAILLAKSKGLFLALFKLKFLLSFFSFLAIYVAIYGWRFGVGFAACILIHEMGHFVDIKRRGLPAEMPVFLPGLGAFVKWKRLGVTKRQVAQVSLAGPLAGWIAAACCAVLYAQTHNPLWAALARTGAILNILNLIPVWVLDGGQAIGALGAVERAALLAAALGIWLYTGQGIFFLVCAGCVWRLFTKDKPAESDWGTWLYFAAVLVALGLVLHAVPTGAPDRPGL
jgi:Zn-dependent protease